MEISQIEVKEVIKNDYSNWSPYFEKIILSEEMDDNSNILIRTIEIKELTPITFIPRMIANLQYKVLLWTITAEEYKTLQKLLWVLPYWGWKPSASNVETTS